MRRELDEALVRDFPLLYRDRYGDMMRTAMCWGFDCGDGWEPLVRRLSERLEGVIRMDGGDARALQVKEKFGGLRFYIGMGFRSEENALRVEEAIQEAEEESLRTCEECGREGKVRGGGWLTCLCEGCWGEVLEARRREGER